MDNMKNYGKIVKGNYIGREGYFTEENKYGLVMFYPKEGIYPYRVCLKRENIVLINKE